MNVYIVDDEPLARAELRYLLEQTALVNVCGESESLKDFYNTTQYEQVDCVFLDIELGMNNGLDLAKQLLLHTKRPEIIFATAFDEYALQAFEVNAFDYILKPFEAQRVQAAVEKLVAKKRAAQAKTMEEIKISQLDKLDKLTVYVNDRILLMKIQDILYCTSEDSKTVVVTEQGRFFASESLAALEKKLTLKGFVRVHRAFIVNLEHIVELEPWSSSKYNLILDNRHSIPVSRLYMKDVRKIFDLSR
ncbi:LytTR family DNA-binding domain-containing protein [Lysinibacillus sp. FSL M8-0216]|uniref:Two component transcriptional regulator, LytTR family n=1 Tax=Lysinibacillus fusiformis TaxID=28031 RepID=A0A1H9JA16_9BACI|nr:MULTISPECIES: LytTR family DNA-binding domain-containing protein [Lysinibacillus]EAZ85244.1 response regulator LytR [Bacillus sp. B14905]HAU33421.1 DNA-binding response regulator [Lysinibacillus sp.]MCG7436916.1 LytTR family DNA-binding domain-containing protein [Lysinibacillus fusiformis]MED4077917.1 LytTR family DNA-binding domain-containing protein [Lysinibacillus fusiformis]MED4669079.1 LytTR family DNA-binding domain-containing protein [Lysinibacillus fusiformis]